MVSALVFISLILDIFRILFFKDKDHYIVSCRFDEKQNTCFLKNLELSYILLKKFMDGYR